MPTMEEYLTRPLADRLTRLRTTPGQLTAQLGDRSDSQLSRRPTASSWSATEIIRHLRDVEELFLTRFLTMLALDEPAILTVSAPPDALAAWNISGDVGHPLDPDRWAEERQYGRCDARLALAAFERRRRELLIVIESVGETS